MKYLLATALIIAVFSSGIPILPFILAFWLFKKFSRR